MVSEVCSSPAIPRALVFCTNDCFETRSTYEVSRTVALTSSFTSVVGSERPSLLVCGSKETQGRITVDQSVCAGLWKGQRVANMQT